MVLQTWFIMSGIPEQTNLPDLPPELLLLIIWMMGYDRAVVSLMFSSQRILEKMMEKYPNLLYHLFVVLCGGREDAMHACIEEKMPNLPSIEGSQMAGIGALRYIAGTKRGPWPCDATSSEFEQAMTLMPEKIRMKSKPSRQGVLAAIEGRRSDDVVMFMLTMCDVVWGPNWISTTSLIDIFLDKAKECERLKLHDLMSEKRRNAVTAGPEPLDDD